LIPPHPLGHFGFTNPKGKYHFRIISIQVSRREIAVYLRYFEGLGVEHFEYFC